MSTRIPTDHRWKVSLEGDFFGNVRRTRNMDFDELGYAKLAKKAQVIYSDTDDNDFGNVLAILGDDSSDNYLIITDDRAFTLNPSTLALTKITNTSTPVLDAGADACAAFGRRYVSSGNGGSTAKYWDGSAWQAQVTDLTTGVPHPMCLFENRALLAIGNGNKVQVYDDNDQTTITAQTLTLPSQYTVMGMRWRQNNLYVFTQNEAGNAKMFIWNGAGTSAQYGYSVNAPWIYSACEFQNSIVIVTSAGQLLKFNGGGFDELENFPVYYSGRSWLQDGDILGKIPQRGMETDGNLLYLNVNGEVRYTTSDSRGSYVHDMPSGIWVYDPAVGLYHKAGSAHEKYNEIAISSHSSNVLTMASAHEAETGDLCLVSDIGSLTGLIDEKMYYVIKGSTTTLSLAETLTDALSGTAVSVTGTVGTAKIKFDRYSSFGATFGTIPGAISTLSVKTLPAPFHASDLIWGVQVTNESGDSKETLQSFGLGRARGSFTLPRITSPSTEDNQVSFTVKFSNMFRATDKILVKAKYLDKADLPTPGSTQAEGRATWYDGDGKDFVVQGNYKNIVALSEGDEVEVVSGSAAGYTSHVASTNYANPPSLYTQLVDSLAPVSDNDTSEVIGDNFQMEQVISPENSPSYKEGVVTVTLGKKSKDIIPKFEVHGSVKIEEIILLNTPS